MPQSEKVSLKGGVSVPERSEGYARKEGKKGRKQYIRAVAITESFASALPRMNQNTEAIAAAKLLKSGAIIRMKDVKEVGQLEIRQQRLDSKKKNAVTDILNRAKNLKGFKGGLDAEELAALDPELKALLDHRKATSGRKRAAEDSTAQEEGAGSAAPSKGSTIPLPAAKKTKVSTAGGGSKGVRVESLATGAGSGGGQPLFASDDAVASTFGKDFL